MNNVENCEVCGKAYSLRSFLPLILPCSHVFCQRCLVALGGQGTPLSCPACQTSCQVELSVLPKAEEIITNIRERLNVKQVRKETVIAKILFVRREGKSQHGNDLCSLLARVPLMLLKYETAPSLCQCGGHTGTVLWDSNIFITWDVATKTKTEEKLNCYQTEKNSTYVTMISQHEILLTGGGLQNPCRLTHLQNNNLVESELVKGRHLHSVSVLGRNVAILQGEKATPEALLHDCEMYSLDTGVSTLMPPAPTALIHVGSFSAENLYVLGGTDNRADVADINTFQEERWAPCSTALPERMCGVMCGWWRAGAACLLYQTHHKGFEKTQVFDLNEIAEHGPRNPHSHYYYQNYQGAVFGMFLYNVMLKTYTLVEYDIRRKQWNEYTD